MRKINGPWKGKWNYLAYFSKGINPHTRSRFQKARICKVYGVRTLRRSCFERTAIQVAISALNEVLHDLGIKGVPISYDQILVLDLEKFIKEVNLGKRDRGAAAGNGFAYIPRNNVRRARFIHDVTHELAHLASFYGLSLSKSGNKVMINQSRSGYSIWKPKRTQFSGLNEAATEILAQLIRRKLPAEIGLTEKERQELFNIGVYVPQCILVMGLLKHSSLPLSLLLRSYIDGSDDFLRELGLRIPHAQQALSVMNLTDKSPRHAAKTIAGKKGEQMLEEEMKRIMED